MSEHQPPASHCANCGHRLAPWDHYCSQCGQDTAGHPPSLWEFVHEWLLHYVAFEGKLWKSLWALLARPGFLTQEYLAGRKQRYVLPLRLLLSFGLLFFVALKFSPDLLDQAVQLDEAAQAAGRAASQPAAARPAAALPPAAASALQGALQQAARETASAPASPVVMNAKDREGLPAWLRGPLERVEKRWAQNREAATLQFKSTLLALAPYAVLLSLPLFAGLAQAAAAATAVRRALPVRHALARRLVPDAAVARAAGIDQRGRPGPLALEQSVPLEGAPARAWFELALNPVARCAAGPDALGGAVRVVAGLAGRRRAGALRPPWA
jgi:hypothetical protein